MRAEDLLALARGKGVMIAAAESCTGGMVMAALTEVPGSSDVVERGFVTYSNEAKIQMLGVAQATLDARGAVSNDVAAEMAVGALRNSRAHLAVSITGIAGPGGSDAKPEGRVCFGIARTGVPVQVDMQEFGALGRGAVRRAARDHALALLGAALERMSAV
ncbi:damage-inducible protein CinA [Pelagivirga sediminicola]|uniref:Damage-inducible protein CinA n=1 Tax=Pelagivirga sediminicola TaxID=2170575 RepID=A0A2T7GBE6_9RHOB|nr:CinA family protein [Pelagivirga sediminicola]PVA11726.1 damage-inducible protein CinA [Pelagivirga sediminicola]